MVDLTEEHREAVRQLCSNYHVKRLELFGSALDPNTFDRKRSDLDFLVEFLPLGQGEHADAYFGLLESLEKLFQRHIDLVMIRAVMNPYFLQAIDASRRLLYAN